MCQQKLYSNLRKLVNEKINWKFNTMDPLNQSETYSHQIAFANFFVVIVERLKVAIYIIIRPSKTELKHTNNMNIYAETKREKSISSGLSTPSHRQSLWNWRLVESEALEPARIPWRRRSSVADSWRQSKMPDIVEELKSLVLRRHDRGNSVKLNQWESPMALLNLKLFLPGKEEVENKSQFLYNRNQHPVVHKSAWVESFRRLPWRMLTWSIKLREWETWCRRH